MGKLRGAAEELTERLELPEDAALGSARLTVVAGKSVLIENHRGILEYGTERVRVALRRGSITVSGTDLTLTAMNAGELLLRGRISGVEWE